MEKSTIKDNKLHLEVTIHHEEEFPIYIFYPESFNQIFEKQSLLDSGMILIETVSTRGYESQEIHHSHLRWWYVLSRFPRGSSDHFEALKKGILENHPKKVVNLDPMPEGWKPNFKK